MYDNNLQINFTKLEKFLKFGYKYLHKDNTTNYKQIFTVPAGCYIKIKNNSIEKYRYWNISTKINYSNKSDYFKI